MNLVEQALIPGEYCHIRLNDGHIITDVTYTGDVDNAGKKYQKFVNGTQTHMVNPSYVAQIIRQKREVGDMIEPVNIRLELQRLFQVGIEAERNSLALVNFRTSRYAPYDLVRDTFV